MLLLDERNPRAVSLYNRVSPFIDFDALPKDLNLVIGGDGWMLSCIRQRGPKQTYLGLNAGMLGFLLNDVNDPSRVGEMINKKEWTSHSFLRLAMRAWSPDGNDTLDSAVNDMYVERMTGQTAHLKVEVDGVVVVEKMVCDGLLVATALGSTAYSFSAGGVPCHPLIRSIHLTPICPHAPRLSPLVLPGESVVNITVIRPEYRPVRAVSDGVDYGMVHRMQVSASEQDLRLAFLDGHHFTETMVRKVLSQ